MFRVVRGPEQAFSFLGAYLSQVRRFLSLQRRSQYVNRMKGAGEGVELLPGQGKFLFVCPFLKTWSWYRPSPHARQGMMDEPMFTCAKAPIDTIVAQLANMD